MWGDDSKDYAKAKAAAAALRAEDGLPSSIEVAGVRMQLRWQMVGSCPYPVRVQVCELQVLDVQQVAYARALMTEELVREIQAELLLRYWQNCVPLGRYEAVVPFMGLLMRCRCDGQCSKAWGLNARPVAEFDTDGNPVEYFADQELGDAPVDPGTYEGGIGKPQSPEQFPTKWCVRECERCNKSDPFRFMDSLPIIDWSKRQ